MGWPYPPDSYEELMYAAMSGHGCVDCLATTHTAGDCPYNKVYCPDWPVRDGDVMGCASYNVTLADDNVYDCLDCGMWFTYTAWRSGQQPGIHTSDWYIDELPVGTMVLFPTYEEINE